MQAYILVQMLIEKRSLNDNYQRKLGEAAITYCRLRIQTQGLLTLAAYRGAWQASATDPTFPVALTIIYTCYKFFTKRKTRNPDGPYFGGSPFWAALGMTVLAFAAGTMVSHTPLRDFLLQR